MSNLKKVKILYVEDDSDTRDELHRFLKRRAGKVFIASSGEEGIEQFAENRPDMIIVDLILPGMNGLEMIKQIKEEFGGCHTLVTTTVSVVDTILKAVDIGIDQYILKPINTSELEQKLEDIANSILAARNREAKSNSFDELIDKTAMEDVIKKEVLKFLKDTSGRGPRDASVFLSGTTVEITAYGALTPMERTILAKPSNTALVEQYRMLFYAAVQKELAEIIERVTGVPVICRGIESKARRDVDKISFSAIQ